MEGRGPLVQAVVCLWPRLEAGDKWPGSKNQWLCLIEAGGHLICEVDLRSGSELRSTRDHNHHVPMLGGQWPVLRLEVNDEDQGEPPMAGINLWSGPEVGISM